MARSEEWLKRWEQLAKNGNPDAQIVVAWEYAKGKIKPKEFDKAVALFRAAELKKPELARFNLAKAKIVSGDETFYSEIREDCDAGFGPALYLIGTVEARGVFRDRNRERAVEYFRLAARSGHLVSEFYAWRLERKSIARWLTTLPRAVRLFVKSLAITIRHPDDLRVLT